MATGKRIDKWLFEQLGEKYTISRTRATKLVSEVVLVNDNIVKPSYRIKVDDDIIIDYTKIQKPKAESFEIIPQEGMLDIIFENNDYMIINKPAGLVVHPGVGHSKDTLVNYLKHYLQDKSLDRAGLVHRLDKGVSGLMVIAKNQRSQQHFKKQFEEHKVTKIYHARQVQSFREREFARDVLRWRLYRGRIRIRVPADPS